MRERKRDALRRKLSKMLPAKHEADYLIPSAALLTEAVRKAISGTDAANWKVDLAKIVTRRHCTLREVRNTARAKAYISQYPRAWPKEDRESIVRFGQEKGWPEVTDVTKMWDKITVMRSDNKRVSSRLRKFNGNMSIRDKSSKTFHISFKDMVPEQKWMNLTPIDFGAPKGRGIIALAPFKKDDIVVDNLPWRGDLEV